MNSAMHERCALIAEGKGPLATFMIGLEHRG